MKKTKTNIKSGPRGKNNSDSRETRFINIKSKGFLLVIILFVFILILAFFFGEGGILELVKTRTEIDQLKKKVGTLEKEKAALIKEIEELKKDPQALERKAREKLWLMKKNEKVVVIVKKGDKKKGSQNKADQNKAGENNKNNLPGKQPNVP